jgi:hypothetical protein
MSEVLTDYHRGTEEGKGGKRQGFTQSRKDAKIDL